MLAQTLARWQGSPAVSPPPAPAATPSPGAETPGTLTESDTIEVDPKLVGIFVRETRQRLDSLRQALAASNAQTVARESHTLKSSSAYFQAHAMHEAAEQLEKMADSGELGKAPPVLQALEEAYNRLRARLEKAVI
jgi:HPt (histidine-containing phosphotransfer) domain-containing protein